MSYLPRNLNVRMRLPEFKSRQSLILASASDKKPPASNVAMATFSSSVSSESKSIMVHHFGFGRRFQRPLVIWW